MTQHDEFTEAERKILHARAEQAARVEQTARAPGQPVIFFRLGRQRCCASAATIRAALQLVGLAPIPGGARGVAGAIARGGEVLPVFHLSSVLGDRLDRLPETAHALVLGRTSDEVAVAVDALEGFDELGADALRAPPEEARSPFITAATADGHLFIDLDALLDSDALWVDASGGTRNG
jgi:chemotaxis signal transduction protein